jgi:hypothetical protein
MLANPYGASTPIRTSVTKTTPRGTAENDNADPTTKPKDRSSSRPPEPHWDDVIAAATD